MCFACRQAATSLGEKDSVFRFPIASVDLSTGFETGLLLSVPFKGKIDAPETNYRSGNLPDGSCSYRTRSY